MLEGEYDGCLPWLSSGPSTAEESTQAKVQEICHALRNSWKEIDSYFTRRRTTGNFEGEMAEDGDDINDSEEVAPYVLCRNVDVAAFNTYLDSAEGRGEKSFGRFMELDGGGNLRLIDWPTAQHESIGRAFEHAFLSACGAADNFATRGGFTASKDSGPNKESDATFGPMDDTPGRGPPPQGVSVQNWATLVVEVGWIQGWSSLERGAQWWAGYAGVQYILCLKVSRSGRDCTYRLYDLSQPRDGDNLPEPIGGGFEVEPGNPEYVTLDARRLLAMAGVEPLPLGVNEHITVDLRSVIIKANRMAPFAR